MKALIASCLLAAPALAFAGPPTLDDLLRRPQYGEMRLSPAGDHLATTVPLDDRTVLAIVRRADMQISTQVDPGKNGFVDDALWVGDRRIFASWSMRLGNRAEPYGARTLYSVDVDGRNRRNFSGEVVAPLLDSQSEVVIVTCAKWLGERCNTRLRRARTDGLGTPADIVDGPLPGAEFLVDRAGGPRFSWAWDDSDVQRLFLRRGDAWQLLNDESQSGVELTPIGTSHDRRFGYLWSEQREGADVIERVDLESGERHTVGGDAERDPHAVVWSLDRREPIGVAYGESAPQVRFFDERHPHATLTRDLANAFTGEFARVTSASRDGRIAVVTVTSDREPGRYYILDTASGDLKLLARSRPWLDPASLSEARPIEFPARDGERLRGYLTLPKFGSGSAAPLVVLPHGGPFDVSDSWEFDEETQMLASHGYAVLRVNFRGSGGRGRSFVERGYRQWGLGMQDDLTDATRWAMAQPGVDGTRVCIWGTSYGGYAALMATIREPELYRCSIGVSGPYHLPTLFKWGDTHRSDWGKGFLARTLGEDMAALLESSPTRHAAAIKAELMLVQGGLDGRVSSEHMRSMRAALDRAGKRYEGYFPPGEGHGFFADESRREYYIRVFNFLDRNLRPSLTAK